MKNIRIRNWLILAVLVIIAVLLKNYEINGFWNGFLTGGITFVLFAELFFLIKGRDIFSKYILRNRNAKS